MFTYQKSNKNKKIRAQVGLSSLNTAICISFKDCELVENMLRKSKVNNRFLFILLGGRISWIDKRCSILSQSFGHRC